MAQSPPQQARSPALLLPPNCLAWHHLTTYLLQCRQSTQSCFQTTSSRNLHQFHLTRHLTESISSSHLWSRQRWRNTLYKIQSTCHCTNWSTCLSCSSEVCSQFHCYCSRSSATTIAGDFIAIAVIVGNNPVDCSSSPKVVGDDLNCFTTECIVGYCFRGDGCGSAVKVIANMRHCFVETDFGSTTSSGSTTASCRARLLCLRCLRCPH